MTVVPKFIPQLSTNVSALHVVTMGIVLALLVVTNALVRQNFKETTVR